MMSAGQPALVLKEVRKRGAGRTKILKAALTEFAAKGYAGATTAGIARKAGVTQPLIHHHFSSKWRLWQAVLDDIYADYREMLAGAPGSAAAQSGEDAPLIERMKSKLIAFVHFSASHPQSARIFMMESAIGGETFDYLYKNYLQPELIALQNLLREGQDKGLLRKMDIALLPFLVIGAVNQPFVAPETLKRLTGLDPLDEKTAHRYATMIADALMEGLREKSA